MKFTFIRYDSLLSNKDNEIDPLQKKHFEILIEASNDLTLTLDFIQCVPSSNQVPNRFSTKHPKSNTTQTKLPHIIAYKYLLNKS